MDKSAQNLVNRSKTLVITGSSRGIGRATALLAAERGFNLCINYHTNKMAAQNVLEEVLEFGVHAVTAQADVSVEAEVKRLFETAKHFNKIK